MDVEGFYQNVLLAFGQNFFRNLGGENRAAFHFDIPMRNLSLWVDDVQVLDRGIFVPPELVHH
jgi:2,5-dihydroxypyridine 5,6-dioxygenase